MTLYERIKASMRKPSPRWYVTAAMSESSTYTIHCSTRIQVSREVRKLIKFGARSIFICDKEAR